MSKGPLNMGILDGEADEFKPRPTDDTRKVPAEEAPDNWPRREEQRPPPEMAQLGLRTDRVDVDKFKRLAREGNWSQPQLLRRMIKAYEMHPNKEELGR